MIRNYLIEEISRLNPLNQVFRLNLVVTNEDRSPPVGS